MARKMVTEWGMSEKMGPLTFGKQEEQIFLGREIAQHRDYSEDTAEQIDAEVKRIVLKGYETARTILKDNADALTRVAEALLEREVLDGDQIAALAKGEPLPEPKADEAEQAVPAQTVEDPAVKAEKDGAPSVLPEPGKQPA
jgi:cell division protease FtsH